MEIRLEEYEIKLIIKSRAPPTLIRLAIWEIILAVREIKLAIREIRLPIREPSR